MQENIQYRTAVWRGIKGKCPSCGQGQLFNGLLKIVDACHNCHTFLGNLPIRDAPIQIAMFLILAIFVPIILTIEIMFFPSVWWHICISAPIIVILTLLLLRFSKGAIAGVLWILQLKE